MKVLASPNNKNAYTEDDIRQFVGLYHLGALNPFEDPVLTAIILEELHKQNEEFQDVKPLSHKKKILKYTLLLVCMAFFVALVIILLYLASKISIQNIHFFKINFWKGNAGHKSLNFFFVI
jgi:hypothetical protein